MSDYRRVTVTLPADVLAAADRLARRLERSRSWVVADALRRFLTRPTAPAADTARPVGAVREQAGEPYAARSGLDEQRAAQLASDLQLTPEQRVREAEDTVELARRLHRPPRAAQVSAFETYEDFLDWREKDLLW